MTVGELKTRMSYTEYTKWIQYFEQANREQAKQERLANLAGPGGQVFDFSNPDAAARMAQTFKEK